MLGQPIDHLIQVLFESVPGGCAHIYDLRKQVCSPKTDPIRIYLWLSLSNGPFSQLRFFDMQEFVGTVGYFLASNVIMSRGFFSGLGSFESGEIPTNWCVASRVNV